MTSGHITVKDVLQYHLPVPFSPALTIAEWKSVFDIVSSSVTTSAVVAGAVWAYFKFVRGRTFKPRLSVAIAAQWRICQDRDVLHVRVEVSNLGASRVWLNQYGTGMRVSLPKESGPEHDEVLWVLIPFVDPDTKRGPPANPLPRVFEIFTVHSWIEPGESISDDLLLDLGRGKIITKLDVALMWSTRKRKTGYRKKDVEVDACRIIPADSTMIDALDKKS